MGKDGPPKRLSQETIKLAVAEAISAFATLSNGVIALRMAERRSSWG